MRELQELVINLNNGIMIPSLIVNIITGILFVVAWQSMQLFKYTTARRWLLRGYNGICWMMFFALGINRFVGYPSAYPLSSSLYVVVYLGFTSLVLFAGYQARREHANQTISAAEGVESFN